MVASETMLHTHHHHLPGRPSVLSTDSVEVSSRVSKVPRRCLEVSSTASRFPRWCRGFVDGVVEVVEVRGALVAPPHPARAAALPHAAESIRYASYRRIVSYGHVGLFASPLVGRVTHMQGAMSLEEAEGRLPDLCPVCLRKLQARSSFVVFTRVAADRALSRA